MAIARIKASKEWFRATAKLVADQPRLERELLAAGKISVRGRELRTTMTAELMCSEVRLLAERLPDEPLVSTALREIEESEARDQARSRRVRAMMDVHRGAPPSRGSSPR